ncbi:uncharacterized [Tachysurus ichikawai]
MKTIKSTKKPTEAPLLFHSLFHHMINKLGGETRTVKGQPCPSPQHFPREWTAEDRLLIRQTIIRSPAVCQADGWCSGTLPLSLMEHGFTTSPPHLSLSPSQIDPCITVLIPPFPFLSPCDKEEDVSSCQGVKYVPCVKSLA